MSAPHARLDADIVVVDASLGGTVAAWRACELGLNVILVSRHAWLGGQFTAQAIPADEHAAIEHGGAPQSYLNFRASIRKHYLDQPDYLNCATMTAGNNPGDGWVSRLCAEPPVLAAEFERLLAPHRATGRLRMIHATRIADVRREGTQILSVAIEETGGNLVELSGRYFLDASDTGELIARADLPFRVGKEASSEFGESLAPLTADPLDQQPVTWVMAMRWHQGPIEVSELSTPPDAYDFWRTLVVPHYGHRQFSMDIPGSRVGSSTHLPFRADGSRLDWWRYRRIVASHQWARGRDDVTLMNCAQNDYALHPLLEGTRTERDVMNGARELSWCFLHWLRTEAPRLDARGQVIGAGYPELAPAPDMTGTTDGLAHQVYVRESRRIVALTTLCERDIVDTDGQRLPAERDDSVGCAWYNLDMHPTCVSGQGVNAHVRPFCLPLGSFIAQDSTNLIPACKNLGVTHLVNASTRTHPTEWLIGEVSAQLAATCIQQQCTPAAIHENPTRLRDFQHQLMATGIPLHWRTEWLQAAGSGTAHS